MNLRSIRIHIARTWIRGWAGRGEGGTEGSGLPKGMVPCTETRTARRGPGLGQVRGLIWGMLTLRKTLSCPKDDTSLELKGPVWAGEHFSVFCNDVRIVDVAG